MDIDIIIVALAALPIPPFFIWSRSLREMWIERYFQLWNRAEYRKTFMILIETLKEKESSANVIRDPAFYPGWSPV